MGRRCCIAGCNSTSRLPEHHGVTYHSFPLDAMVRALWIRHTRIPSEKNITKSVLVCSRHFRRADFQPQRSGKYLLKQRVFPTVFPWGKVEQSQVEADQEELAKAAINSVGTAAAAAALGSVAAVEESSDESATKATVEATVAQIMAEAAELNAVNVKHESSDANLDASQNSNQLSSTPAAVKFEPVTNFNPGARLEAQDFDGIWHSARVVEVDNDDREVLIKFERTGKNKSAIVGTEEWIPMNSNRLRQKVSNKPIPVFELEEKCLARWSGPRKFPGTVKKILPNDVYEVLFDDGYIKNVRAIHMSKINAKENLLATPSIDNPSLQATAAVNTSLEQANISLASTPIAKAIKRTSPMPNSGSSSKKRAATGSRKDWPLLDMSKLDLASLNLPEIPQDGEWTCHWVNDQPIGKEGFLIVGEHRKPTVIVEDWRLPPGWVKHMYQRSNVLGKWDVILVTPNQKRFRSKADLKNYLEEQGQYYNPDIYDFSIHRRRAKDIGAYVYTSDYTPQTANKSKTLDSSVANDAFAPGTSAAVVANVLNTSDTKIPYLETPIASAVPPMELMTSPDNIKMENTSVSDLAVASTVENATPLEDGYAYIGGLKVQIIDNLFRCPQEGCFKNFRKENHLQIHVKHYHTDLIKLLGDCPKMQELAEKRTHPNVTDPNEPLPKNQIPNQQFFAKLHQQDLEQTRAHRRSQGTANAAGPDIKAEIKEEQMDIKTEQADESKINFSLCTTADMTQTSMNSSMLDASLLSTTSNNDSMADLSGGNAAAKRARHAATGSRKSNRQRTTRRYLTAAQATAGAAALNMMDTSNFGVSDFEETRHSFNATPDAKTHESRRQRKTLASAMASTPLSSIDSPITADSGSSSMQAGIYNDADMPSSSSKPPPQYIKENGELIKIVRMKQEEIINCLCSYGEEDGLMIQCELCLCWQHGICNGIDKEADVPEKYVCYLCRNPQRGRDSMRFKHDQDWLYDGKLPTANYHISNADLTKRFEFLKKSHTLTGNLIELKQFMHSLRVKINIANNRCHQKLYLWAKKWDEEATKLLEAEIKEEGDIKLEKEAKKLLILSPSPSKKIKSEPNTPAKEPPMPNIPMPEAPIDPAECQQRLLEHVRFQQNLVMNRLNDIEAEIDELEKQDDLPDLKNADISTTKDILATFIKELDTLKQIAKLNALEHTKQAYQNQQQQQHQAQILPVK